MTYESWAMSDIYFKKWAIHGPYTYLIISINTTTYHDSRFLIITPRIVSFHAATLSYTPTAITLKTQPKWRSPTTASITVGRDRTCAETSLRWWGWMLATSKRKFSYYRLGCEEGISCLWQQVSETSWASAKVRNQSQSSSRWLWIFKFCKMQCSVTYFHWRHPVVFQYLL